VQAHVSRPDGFALEVDAWRTKAAPGAVVVVRLAADMGLGCAHRRPAVRFLAARRDCRPPFGLALPAEQTRLRACGPHALANRKQRGDEIPETCDWWGFPYLGERHRKPGSGTGRRKTARTRMVATLQAISQQRRPGRPEAAVHTGQ
jgi:hypothetical protein